MEVNISLKNFIERLHGCHLLSFCGELKRLLSFLCSPFFLQILSFWETSNAIAPVGLRTHSWDSGLLWDSGRTCGDEVFNWLIIFRSVTLTPLLFCATLPLVVCHLIFLLHSLFCTPMSVLYFHKVNWNNIDLYIDLQLPLCREILPFPFLCSCSLSLWH